MAQAPVRKKVKAPIPVTIEEDSAGQVTFSLDVGTSQAPVSFMLKTPAKEFSERLNALEIVLPTLLEMIVSPSELPTGQEMVRFIAGAYTLTLGDSVLVVDCSMGDVAVNLPSATNMGKRYVICKEDSSANTCTISAFGNDTIENATSKTLSTRWSKAVLESDGVSNWLDLLSGGL